MVLVINCKKLLRKNLQHYRQFHLSKYLNKDRLSRNVRQTFLDYFIRDHNHSFVRSSPIVPYCDPTVAFVNAGMNQFKGIFLGTQTPAHTKVANSQKCVRVGGKHNDLNVIGADGYHHTFFEMLGSWSFGDYFKQEACEMAWKLLTDVYKINKSSLYVTYFGGDEKLGLEADLECKHIWQLIGLPDDKILPFGVKDNFWEMGMTGPCGPCTEIHVDHRGGANRSQFVNKGLHDLTEIWNIVFIQYNRNSNGSIMLLPQHHVDTGLGFERLCALLQGKISNYDTDLFMPLFAAIHKNCKEILPYRGLFGEKDWNELDKNYRILADHARMVTACLADGMIPEENQKLRRIIRKALLLSDTVFKRKHGLLKELSNYVVESLGPVYNEMERNIKQVHQMIDYEEDLFTTLRTSSLNDWQKIIQEEPTLSGLDVIEMPGLVNAYQDIKNSKITQITPTFGFKLYDTFGLDEDVILKLSHAMKLEFDVDDFRRELQVFKLRNKEKYSHTDDTLVEQLLKAGLAPTDDSFKYDYSKNEDRYVFKNIPCTVKWIINDNNASVNSIADNTACSLIFDQTNLYHESGGQVSDKGYAVYNHGIFEIKDLQKINGIVLHKGRFVSDRKLTIGESLTMQVNEDRKLRCMQNHTAIHLLNAVIKKLKGHTCQKSSKVTDSFLSLDLGMFGNKLNRNDIKQVEDEVNNLIRDRLDVTKSNISSQELLCYDNVTVIPGEIYPDNGIRLVEIIGSDFLSREPCCGTHVFNTGDIEEFRIINCRSMGRSTFSIEAVTGERAKDSGQHAVEVMDLTSAIEHKIDRNNDKPEHIDMAINELKQRLNYNIGDNFIVPATVKHECLDKLNVSSKKLKNNVKSSLKAFVEMEMKSVLQSQVLKSKNNVEYVVHYLRSSMILESVPLQKATKLCPDMPVLVISYSDDIVKARCCVPENLKSDNFNAEKWMSQISSIFKSSAVAPKGQDPMLVCNLKPRHINIQEWHTLLNESVNTAIVYAEKHL